MRLTSEFASVEIGLDESGNGPRLKVTDLRSGQIGYLDPLELETIAWLDKDDLAPLFNAGMTRRNALDDADATELARLEKAWFARKDPRTSPEP